ncbi:MAG: HDOD domain-containing protein [Nitrospinaceae bacterium]
MSLTLEKVTQNLIASPPGIYFRLKEAIEDPDSTFEDFSQFISADPALAARLLKIVNSPFYGLGGRIETIPHALNIVGTDHLSELALATSVISNFEGIPKGLVNLKQFWTHCVGTGVAARYIARRRNLEDPDRYYIGGMLHDIGKLVLFREVPSRYQEVLETYAHNKTRNLLDLEMEVMGFTHAQIGGILLKEWRLPPALADAVQHHHTPDKAKINPRGAAVVHLADFMTYELQLGDSGEPVLPPLCKITLRELDLDLNFIREAQSVVTEETADVLGSFLQP